MNKLKNESNFLKNKVLNTKKGRKSHIRSRTKKSQVNTFIKIKQVWFGKDDPFVIQSKGLVNAKVVPLGSHRTSTPEKSLRVFSST